VLENPAKEKEKETLKFTRRARAGKGDKVPPKRNAKKREGGIVQPTEHRNEKEGLKGVPGKQKVSENIAEELTKERNF